MHNKYVPKINMHILEKIMKYTKTQGIHAVLAQII